jgi:aldehyde:ferredoxin oxidoreductase
VLNEPATGGSEGLVSHLEPMLEEYYRGRGWDENGVPRPDKLAELGLADLAKEVVERG